MSENVLLVDDEADFLDALSRRMETRGMHVSTSSNAVEALAMVRKGSYDAIILDLQMPGMDGIEALRELKAEQPDLQVILLTGHASVEKGIEAMKLGAMDFLEKPADIEALTDKIKKAQARKMVLVEKHTEETLKEILGTKSW